MSQDAFICYLLSWVDPGFQDADPFLHKCANEFVSAMMRSCDSASPASIQSVEVLRQRFHLDILVKINADIVLGIEDKIWTKSHGTQLKDYHAALKGEYRAHKICLVYLKTGNENPRDLASYLADGFHCFGRKDFLAVLNTYEGCNAIILDFRARLQDMEDWSNAFQEKPVAQWDNWQWQGFYNELYQKYADIGWDYVANPRGGFMGAWWHWQDNQNLGLNFYLQFEQEKLCVKIEDSNAQMRESWKKQKLLDIINEKCAAIPFLVQDGYRFKKPARFGNGNYMTIGILESTKHPKGSFPCQPNGIVDLKALFEVTDRLCEVVDQLGTVAV